VRIEPDAIELAADYGTTERSFPAPAPEITGKTVRYATAAGDDRLVLRLRREICADVATGMPHPWRAVYRLNGTGHAGCGGDPVDLLTGEAWTVTAIAGQEPVGADPITLDFSTAGRVAGHSGCNRYSAAYTIGGEGLRIDRAAATRMACIDDAVARQERRFLQMLPTVRRFGMDGPDRLVVYTGDGERIVATR